MGKLHVIPGTIELEDFDEGDEGVAYHDLEPRTRRRRNRPIGRRAWTSSGAKRPAASSTWDGPGPVSGSSTRSMSRQAGTYRIDMHVACKGPGGTFHLEFNGVDRTGPITVPDTGGWEHLKPFSHEGVKLVAGRQVMKVVMATGGKSGSIGDIDYFKFVKQ